MLAVLMHPTHSFLGIWPSLSTFWCFWGSFRQRSLLSNPSSYLAIQQHSVANDSNIPNSTHAFDALCHVINTWRTHKNGVALLCRSPQHFERIWVPNHHLKLGMVNALQKLVFLTVVLLVYLTLRVDQFRITENHHFLLQTQSIVNVQLTCLHTLSGIFQHIQSGTGSKCCNFRWQLLQKFYLWVFLKF